MLASELVNRLNALINDHGDQHIIIDSEYGEYNTVCDVDFVIMDKSNYSVCGFELDTCIENFS